MPLEPVTYIGRVNNAFVRRGFRQGIRKVPFDFAQRKRPTSGGVALPTVLRQGVSGASSTHGRSLFWCSSGSSCSLGASALPSPPSVGCCAPSSSPLGAPMRSWARKWANTLSSRDASAQVCTSVAIIGGLVHSTCASLSSTRCVAVPASPKV